MSTEPILEAQQLVKDYVSYKTQKVHGRSMATANWVTTLAHDCEAYAVFMRTVPVEKRIAMKGSLGMIFSEGDDQARAIKRDLLSMGYEVEGAEGQVAWKEYQITGRQDLTIRREGIRKGIDCEIKSCAPFTYDSISSVEDLKNHKWPFIVKWYRQCCLYMVLKGVEKYWMLLKNKSTGQIKIIEMVLDDEAYKTADWMVTKAQAVNKLVQIGEMPSENQKISSPDLCPECEMFAVCNPAIDFGVAAQVLGEEEAAEMEKKLDRWWEIKEMAKEFGDLDDELKGEAKSLAAPDGEQIVIGNWIASLKYQPVKEEKAPRKAFVKTIVKFNKMTAEKKA